MALDLYAKGVVAIDNQNYFVQFAKLDLRKYEETKNGLTFLPWAVVWEEFKKVCPNAIKKDYPQIMDDYGNTRFWHDDGRTGWVDIGIEIDGREERLQLPIMDFKNNAIPADKITSTDANKAYMRCLVKVCALWGIGLYVYRRDDMPQEIKDLEELQTDCMKLIKDKAALSAKTKETVAKICRDIDPDANGDPRLITDLEKLKSLKKHLLAVRKAPTKQAVETAE